MLVCQTVDKINVSEDYLLSSDIIDTTCHLLTDFLTQLLIVPAVGASSETEAAEQQLTKRRQLRS